MRLTVLRDSAHHLRFSGFAALLLLVSLGTSQTPAADLERELVIVGSGGALGQALKENFYDPFTKETGVTILTVPAFGGEMLAKIKAMSAAGRVEWDIVSVNLDEIMAHRDAFARIDCGSLPNVASQAIPGACDEYSVIKQLDGSVLAFSTTAFPPGRQPRSWADFWDVARFPGPRGLPNYGVPYVTIAAALMADGLSIEQMRPPLDLDRAFRKLDSIKPHVRVWWKTGDQSQQIMKDGEVVMTMMWSGRALKSKSSGVPIDITWNQAIMHPGRWAVLKNAPHQKAATAFLNFFIGRPDAHVAFTRQIFYDTANRRALELLPEERRPNSALYGDNLRRVVNLDPELATWLANNRDRMLERWNTWLAQ